MLAITHNLWHLLKRIRQPHEDRYLWIDAIAINQDDDWERAHQVQRMRSIYNGAERVIFYLGEETALIEVLMQSLTSLQRHVSGGQWAPDDKRWKAAWEKVQGELLLNHHGATLKNTQQQGLKEIIKRPWFRRVWVLQEVANARRALVYCGAASVRAQIFAIAPTLLDVELDSYAAAVFELMPRYPGKSSRKPRDGDFFSILLDFRQSEASDPRDKIFALLGLCKDQDIVHKIVPDYSQTEADVVSATITYIVDGGDIGRSVASVEEFLSGNFLSGLVRDSATDAAISFLIYILSSCTVETVKHFLAGKSIILTQEAVDAAASNKYNPAEMMVFLLRIGGHEESFHIPYRKIQWSYACIDLIKKLEATMEMAAWSLGGAVLSVQQKDLHPLLFFASKCSLGKIIPQLKGEDIGTSELLRKLRQTVNRGGQNVLQQDMQDDFRKDMNDQPLQISTTINRKEIIRVLLENHGNTTERTENWMHLFMAVLSREIEIVELVLEMNPGEFDTPCKEANLALGYAMDQHWGGPIVFCLLSKGVKLTLIKNAGAPQVEGLYERLSRRRVAWVIVLWICSALIPKI
ncbi:hypothetical protein NUW58_g2055 [Xylaria curta]|uniref:Uncharacterized protein n=1 Tax=Xylaria curta TaxID=42375 RepID=A0ACC1PHF1_9PEZI|nr:hypothetical protein NUW58_g2055 [Xylaria curta]